MEEEAHPRPDGVRAEDREFEPLARRQLRALSFHSIRFAPPALLLGWLAGSPLIGVAQEAALVGYVLDQESLTPLQGASVSIPAQGIQTRTGSWGDFVLQGLPAGPASVRVEVPGYSILMHEVDITDGEIAMIEFHVMRLEAILAAIVAEGEARPMAERVRNTSAVELSDLAHREGKTALDLLTQQVPGISAAAASGLVGAGGRVVFRGPGSISLGNEPSIYLNGLRISQEGGDGSGITTAFQILEGIQASEVRRIQILRGPAAGPASHGSPAGVILIDTTSDPGPGAMRLR